jgi:hypothetical protein
MKSNLIIVLLLTIVFGFSASKGDYLFMPEVDGEWWQVAHNPDPGAYDDRYMVGQLKVAAPEIIKVGSQYYIAALMPGIDGIRIAKLTFKKNYKSAK